MEPPVLPFCFGVINEASSFKFILKSVGTDSEIRKKSGDQSKQPHSGDIKAIICAILTKHILSKLMDKLPFVR